MVTELMGRRADVSCTMDSDTVQNNSRRSVLFMFIFESQTAPVLPTFMCLLGVENIFCH